MAVRIDRIEREFILGAAAEAKTEARLMADGRTLKSKLAGFGAKGVDFSVPGAGCGFRPRELVSVCFDFRGQAVAFDSPVLGFSGGTLALGMPQSMYRSLSRRWARVSKPRSLSVDFLLPDAEMSLDCPVSGEWVDVELPELRAGLDSRSLAALVESFKTKAREIATEGRVIMFKDKGPADFAEEIASRTGRILYVPSTSGKLPIADPYPAGRIVTRALAEDFEGFEAIAAGSKLSPYLAARAGEGLHSGIWCPILYYQYAVGVVYVANGPDRPRALDLEAVDLAWEFSRILAWFLKRHGYFAEAKGGEAAKEGSVVDASPSGILAVLPPGSPKVEKGTTIRMRLGLKEKRIICTGKVARRYDEGDLKFCGIAFMDLSAEDKSLLSLCLYGDEGAVGADLETGAK